MVTQAPSEDEEPSVGSEPAPQQSIKPARRRATHSARRDLSEKELNSPGVQQMLLDELALAEEQIADLNRFRDDFHRADKQVAVLEEKSKIVVSQEIISFMASALGGAAMGFFPSVWATPGGGGGLALAVGLGLLVAGVVAKVVRSK